MDDRRRPRELESWAGSEPGIFGSVFGVQGIGSCNFAERIIEKRYGCKGASEMCRILEDMRKESLKKRIKEGMREAALRISSVRKYAFEEIANRSGLSFEEIDQRKAKQNT